MKTRKKKIAIAAGLILFLLSLGTYAALRSGSLEKEYVSIITLKNSEVLKHLDNKITDKPEQNNEIESAFKKVKNNVPEIAIVALADKNYNIIIAGKNSRHSPGKDTLDSILSDFTRKKLQPKNSFPLVIRYYDQSRFYIYVNEVNSYYILTVFPYIMTDRQVLSFALETLLILIIFIILIMSAIIIIDRKEESTEEENTPVAEDHVHAEKAKDRHFVLKECAGTINADSVSLQKYNDTNKLFYTSAEYNEGEITVPPKKNRHETILIDDLIEELYKQTIVLLEKNTTYIIPLLKDDKLKGVIRINRHNAFRGDDLSRVESFVLSHIDELVEMAQI